MGKAEGKLKRFVVKRNGVVKEKEESRREEGWGKVEEGICAPVDKKKAHA